MGDDSTTWPKSPVVWTRGEGCAELANILSIGEPTRVSGDLVEACLAQRAGLVVSRRLSVSFDLVSQAVPLDLDVDRIQSVVAAVAGGPHSPLAARVARRMGDVLGVPASMACAYRNDEDRTSAVSLIENLYRQVPGIEYRLVQTEDASGLVSQLSEGTGLILGAPGGNWLQRTFFGQGAKLRQKAPAGAVVVKVAPARVFQIMGDPVFVGPLREAIDILRIHEQRTLAVVDRARLIGIVRRDALELAEPGVPVAELMEDPVSVALDAALDELAAVADRFHPDPVPVIDDGGRLVGGVVLDGRYPAA